jgi:hypothetical protein
MVLQQACVCPNGVILLKELCSKQTMPSYRAEAEENMGVG